MKMTNAKAMAVGAALSAFLTVTTWASVPAATDFDSAYFRTSSLPVTIVGPLTNLANGDGSALTSAGAWTFPGGNPTTVGTVTANGVVFPGSITNSGTFSVPVNFGGIIDDVLYAAHNLTPGTSATALDLTKPIWKTGLEYHYVPGDGTEHSEYNIDFSWTNSIAFRPFSIDVEWVGLGTSVSLSGTSVGIANADRTATRIYVDNNGASLRNLGLTNNFADGQFGYRQVGTITNSNPVGFSLGANLASAAGGDMVMLDSSYNAFGIGNTNYGSVYGLRLNGASWTKGTSGTIANTYPLYVSAPTIGNANNAAYFVGDVTVTSGYTYAYGLRLSGFDQSYSIYQSSGNLGIVTASGTITIGPSFANTLVADNTKVKITGDEQVTGTASLAQTTVTNFISFGGTQGTNQLYAVGTNLFWNGKQVTVSP